MTIFPTLQQIPGQVWQIESSRKPLIGELTEDAIAKESRLGLSTCGTIQTTAREHFEVKIFCMQKIRTIEIQILDLQMSIVSKGLFHEKLWMTVTLDISSYPKFALVNIY